MSLNTLRPRQSGRHFADDIFKWTFLNENLWIPIEISLKFVPQGPINNIPALVQIMAWRRPGDKPLSGSMMVILPTHICVTWPQWVKTISLAVGQSYDYTRAGKPSLKTVNECFTWIPMTDNIATTKHRYITRGCKAPRMKNSLTRSLARSPARPLTHPLTHSLTLR